MVTHHADRLSRPVRAIIAILPVVVACGLGQLATAPNLAPWYEGLVKPVFNPPNWLFAPVWTTLYVLMMYAVWRVLSARLHHEAKPTALFLFFGQLALNALWPWLFFARHSPRAGVLEIIPQLILVVATIIAFGKIDRVAAWCLVPLAVWVAFATLLNAALWSLNG